MKNELTDNPVFLALIAKVQLFDFDYKMSDDDRWYRKGQQDESEIKDAIEELWNDGFNARELERTLLHLFPERSKEGITHTTIRKWFKDYLFTNNQNQ
jgi:hypothetical protein